MRSRDLRVSEGTSEGTTWDESVVDGILGIVMSSLGRPTLIVIVVEEEEAVRASPPAITIFSPIFSIFDASHTVELYANTLELHCAHVFFNIHLQSKASLMSYISTHLRSSRSR